MKMLFIFNPMSGKNHIKNNLASIIDIFVKGGYEVVVHPTQGKDDAKSKIVSAAEKFDIIVISGGDGTLSEAVGALMQIQEDKRPVLGYIPSGTTNDFATSCNIPKNDMIKAAKNIVEGKVNRVDIGKANDKYFSYIAAFGAFTEVSYGTNQNIKNALGYAAYILEGIKSLTNIKAHRLRIKYDDKVIEDDFIFGMVSNSFSVAGMRYNDDIDISLSDGIFECILVKNPTNPIEFQFTIADLLTNNIKSDKFVFIKTSDISFLSDEEIDWTMDGEYGGSLKEVDISICKQALKIITQK